MNYITKTQLQQQQQQNIYVKPVILFIEIKSNGLFFFFNMIFNFCGIAEININKH